MNELAKQTSIYLKQHATNPIHWKAWNNSIVQQQNKLLIISIGYTACHWCHVMEHETFEDEEVGVLMNNHFTSIKVDREEHPDVDTYYMKAVQLMTKSGGWPLNVVCLPNGMPIWGGTYFKKDDWLNALNQLRILYEQSPEKVIDYAEKLKQGIAVLSVVVPKSENAIFDTYDELLSNWKKSFDTIYGGYERTPKFMMPTNLDFLYLHATFFKDQYVKKHVENTLTKMAWGGLFDCIGGGFSRYSVDEKWHIPHFEKMLYDNAQLLTTYSKVYLKTKDTFYKNSVVQILENIESDFKNGTNGYFASLDADSSNENGIAEEGAFYSWKKEELQELLGDNFPLFSDIFNINDFGYWEEFDKYVLIQNESLENLAKKHEISIEKLESKIKHWKQTLFEHRKKRKPPICDTKCITSWNGLLLKGFCTSYDALQDENILEKAKELANYLQFNAYNGDYLWHIHSENDYKIKGYLEDHVFVIEGFIALYQATFEEKYLLFANELTSYCLLYFYDEKTGFFAQNETSENETFTPHFETEDNVIPATNSVFAHQLYYLSIAFENVNYEKIVAKMLQIILPEIDFGSGYSNWLQLYLIKEKANSQLTITGKDALQLKKELLPQLDSAILIFGCNQKSEIPYLKNKFDSSKSMLYLCAQSSCFEPKTTPTEILKLLKL